MARATELIEGADIMVFSKVSCGFSTRAKQAIVSNVEGAKEKMEVLELDMEPVSQIGSEACMAAAAAGLTLAEEQEPAGRGSESGLAPSLCDCTFTTPLPPTITTSGRQVYPKGAR